MGVKMNTKSANHHIREIWCLHHSHLDIGYTHPQNFLLELQKDYIDETIDLCLAARDYPEESRFRWTAEATLPVVRWFETAEPERRETFRELVKEGLISVTAMPVHTTPGAALPELVSYFQQLDQIRGLTGSAITTAINHDVNGQPWTMASLLLDSGVKFYLTGINVHFGGIPFARPYAFRWETPDGRLLPSFVGEHYSLFSQFAHTCEEDTARMHEGLDEYVRQVEETTDWPEDFVLLTATNPPLYDNNQPDTALASLIRRYNEEDRGYTVRFVTPEMIYARLAADGLEKLDVQRGDWTDYWNFGSASTAREVRISRKAKTLLSGSDYLDFIGQEPSERIKNLSDRAYENAILFDEHTWGAAESIDRPDDETSVVQKANKKTYAYEAAEQAAYLAGRKMEETAENPIQSDHQDGILAVNPTAFAMDARIRIPSWMLRKERTLAALRMKEMIPYTPLQDERTDLGTATLPPFSSTRIPFSSLSEATTEEGPATYEKNGRLCFDTPFYTVELCKATGHILQITEREGGRALLSEERGWSFGDVVRETIDPRFAAKHRDSLFFRDVDAGNRSASGWKNDWRAVREGISEAGGYSLGQTRDEIVLTIRSEEAGMKSVLEKVTFFKTRDGIRVEVTLDKLPVREPEGIYVAFPLLLKEGWDCVYDTAGTNVRLDEEQLGTVCRDYLTVDQTISLFDDAGGYTLCCPDAPMVQTENFSFGKSYRKVPRRENPLLLGWPMNNYWSTNFACTQEGVHTFRYELCPFKGPFDPIRAYREGLAASDPVLIGAAVDCGSDRAALLPEKQLTYESGHTCPVFVRPAADRERKNEFLLALRNFSGDEDTCTLNFNRPVQNAAVTDIQGNTLEPLKLSENGNTGNTVSVSVPGRRILYITIRF